MDDACRWEAIKGYILRFPPPRKHIYFFRSITLFYFVNFQLLLLLNAAIDLHCDVRNWF
jgi:hypothetical protein